jgi:D-aminoacyl-tRNA deacylase
VRAVVQRVSQASVRVGGDIVSACDVGLLVLVGVAVGDGREHAETLARKIARLRVFSSEEGRLDLSVVDVGGAVLAVSQFTLIADTAKGNRPSFVGAAPAGEAEPLYDHFCDALCGHGVPVRRGVFGAHMAISLVNDGPVTILLET